MGFLVRMRVVMSLMHSPRMEMMGSLLGPYFVFKTDNLRTVFAQTTIHYCPSFDSFLRFFHPDICHMRMRPKIVRLQNFNFRMTLTDSIRYLINPFDQDPRE
jgi:hypothetical protein